MTNSDLWPQILGQLEIKMTKATFDAWLRHTTGQLNGNTLTVGVTSTYALDWLEHRLKTTIEQTAFNVAQRKLEIVFNLAQPETNAHQPELILSSTYRDLYNQIIKPDRVFVATQYYRQAWLPLLGPNLWIIILEMRQRCYWNKSTGEKRANFEATYNELGAATGLSRNTIWRSLNPTTETEQTYLSMFIPSREILKQYSQYRSVKINKNILWTVRLDDPLTPEDEAKINDLTKYQNGT